MSLDGYITGLGPASVGTPFQAAGDERELLDEAFARLGPVVMGRNVYDAAQGSQQRPLWSDTTLFVLTRH